MNKGQFCLSMGKSDKSIWQLALIVSLKIEREEKILLLFFHVFMYTAGLGILGTGLQRIIPYTCSWFIRYVIGWHFRRKKKHFLGKIIFSSVGFGNQYLLLTFISIYNFFCRFMYIPTYIS